MSTTYLEHIFVAFNIYKIDDNILNSVVFSCNTQIDLDRNIRSMFGISRLRQTKCLCKKNKYRASSAYLFGNANCINEWIIGCFLRFEPGSLTILHHAKQCAVFSDLD